MADNEYLSGMNILMQGKLTGQNVEAQSPEEAIQSAYDGQQEETSGLNDLLLGVQMQSPGSSAYDKMYKGRAAQELASDQFSKLDELNRGPNPQQELVDPDAVIGSAGVRFERGVKAGWGDLVVGTGDTIDFINAWVRPGDPEPSTTLGSYLKKVGEEYQNDNVLVLSEDMKDVTFGDLFKGEFWSSKISRLLPYALSFIVPYAGGARAGAFLLGRYGMKAAKWAHKTKKYGAMGRFGQTGTGVVGKIAFDAGRKGIVPMKKALDWSGYIGGGLAANLTEGAYLAGEAYNQMLSEVDDNGNPSFSPDEAANIASGVMTDNGKWAAVDVIQYGLLFGGLGKNMARRLVTTPLKKTPFKASIKGLTSYAMNRVAPNLPTAAAYASVEGLTEGFQEVYQEWAKYANIQEGKGQDYESWTTWLKEAPFAQDRPELRDIFWSSVGLGLSMGGVRGYYDAAAERTKAYNEKVDGINNNFELLKDQSDPATIYENEKYIQDNIIAEQLWNYYGDGSGLKSYINQQVKDNKMPQEVADDYIAAIEEAEKSYEKHAVNTGLTEAGAKQAFFRETRLKRNASQQAEEKSAFEELVKKKSENIKDKDKLEKALAGDKEYHAAVMELLMNEESELLSELEMIYTRKRDDAPIVKKTGKRDKRYKVKGLSKDEYETYTQEGAKEKERVENKEWTKEEREQKLYEMSESEMSFKDWKQSMSERHGAEYLDQFNNDFINQMIDEESSKETKKESFIEKVKGTGKKAIQGIKDIYKGVKEKVKKWKGKTEEEIKEIKDSVDKISATSSAKKAIISALENDKLTQEEVEAIKGSGRKGIINKGDVEKAVEKAERQKTKEEGARQDSFTEKEYNEKLKKDRGAFKENKNKSNIVTILDENSYKTVTYKKGKFISKKNINDIKVGDVIMTGNGVAFTVVKITEDSAAMAGKIIKAKQVLHTQEFTLKDGIYTTEKISEEITNKKSDEDVKKKDQPTVVPKTKIYEETEDLIRKKGKPLNLKGVSISKVVSALAGAASYFIKTKTGKTIKFFTRPGIDIREITRVNQDVQLKLIDPVKGEKNVVEINGKLYFQYKKGAPLYSSAIEVLSNGKVIGVLEYQAYKEDKGPTKKAKKAKTKSTAKKVIDAINDTKENIQNFLNKSFDETTGIEDFAFEYNLNVYTDSGFGSYALTQQVIQKQFPGTRGYVISSKLIDDYGQESVALAIGASVIIKEQGIKQTDLIHELGHVYYGIMEDTPLMRRVRKLLRKSDLYKRTLLEYPELRLMHYEGKKVTLGRVYKELLHKINRDENVESDLKDIVVEIYKTIGKDNTRTNELFASLRLQLKSKKYKDVRSDGQKHIIEETFTRTLESYSYGTLDSVIKGTAAQKQIKKDLIEFYKKIKNLATDEEAKRFLDLSVDEVANLDLEAAIKHILLDFKSGERTIPTVKNSAYSDIKKASNSALKRISGYSAVYSYIGDYIGRNLSPEEISTKVMKDMMDDSLLPKEDVGKLKKYIEVIVIQREKPNDLKKADKELEKILSEVGVKIDEEKKGDDKDFLQVLIDKEKNIALPTTTSNFIKKIVEVHNSRELGYDIDRKDLLYNLYVFAKETMYDPYDFINKVRTTDNRNVKAALNILDEVYEKEALTDAKLMEIKAPIEGINIEVLTHGTLVIGKGGKKSWKKHKDISRTLEGSVINNIKTAVRENADAIGEDVSNIYNRLFKKRNPNRIDRYIAAQEVLEVIFGSDPKGKLINIPALLNNPILFNGKNQFLQDILFDHSLHPKFKNPVLKNQSLMAWDSKRKRFTDQTGRYKAKGLIHGKQGELHVILTEGLILSRAMNYLSIVDNVNQEGVSIFNKENGLHNRSKNIANLINNEGKIDKNNIIHPDNNIYSVILYSKKKRGKLADKSGKVLNNPFQITVHSGLMRYLMNSSDAVKYEERTAKLNNLAPNELMANDFFMFLSSYNKGVKEDIILYDQVIAVFGDKSRRYYIQSIAAHNSKMTNVLLSKIKNNPAYKGKFKNRDKVFPFNIVGNKNLSIKEMPELVAKLKQYIRDNKELYKNNEDMSNTEDMNHALSSFLTSYIANKFMAQQLLVHDHRQSKSEIDYIKRAAGAIAGHIVFDRNIKIEPILIKDYYIDIDGEIYTEKEAKERYGKDWGEKTAIENDAMGYILPEQAEAIRTKYGEVQKVGNVFKFVYHYTETEGKLVGKTTYLKFAIHVLTPKMEKMSGHFKNIGNILRERHKRVSKIVGSSGFNHGNLIIAASESAAKLFKDDIRGDAHIHDIRDAIEFGTGKLGTLTDPSIKEGSKVMEEIMNMQDDLYVNGDKDSELRTYQGLSGEGFGIQLELDKEASERFFPSQLFYHLATNITSQEQSIIDEMYALRKKVMEANNKERNKGLITEKSATQKQVIEERDSFVSSVSADVFGVLVDSMYGFTDPRYPYLNAVHNSIAAGKTTHKGTKMYTKGSIAYQSSSLGMNLGSYKKVKEYFDKDGRYLLKSNSPQQKKFRYELEKLMFGKTSKPNTLISEAIIPGYMQKYGVGIGDLFIGTRVPAHGKVSSTVFIVKDFHKQIGTSPTSNITIPAWVSKNWGADLDGDAIHMNFKFTEEEVNKKEWRGWSNEFFDKYVDLVSKESKFGELTADIDFVQAAEKAIAKTQQTSEGTAIFDKKLAQKIQDKLEKLYPEIKLNITNNPVWEQGNNIFNQEEFNNQVNYRLKATEILLSDKAKQIFAKGEKAKWDLNKILTELQVPKEQKQLILDLGITDREQLALELVSNYSFAVEINIAKALPDSLYDYETGFEYNGIQYGEDRYTGEYWYVNEFGDNTFISEKEYKKIQDSARKNIPSQYYSNLTVPGGTNYTENEIATPDIIPNIQGHAQFSTDKGIGWFRSDEAIIGGRNKQVTGEYADEYYESLYERAVDEIGYKGTLEEFRKSHDIIGTSNTKTRRILEVQSDLFQKGRDKENLIQSQPDNYISLSSNKGNVILTDVEYRQIIKTYNPNIGDIVEYNGVSYIVDDLVKESNITQNQFLQLLNKDNNWITFFIKSIVQDSAKKGYEKVLFPKGDTAAKIEGHQTLEEFKKSREREIKKSQDKIEEYDKVINKELTEEDKLFGTPEINRAKKQKESALAYIDTLKQELADVESGQTQLSSIANFYETTVTNILKKNGYNPVEITDEYGNKWNEIQITPEVLSNILLQKNESNNIIGQSNIKAGTVLIDAVNQKIDTIPHEYAHHYIAWFRDTAIVQEAIKKWGSEEALVQSIGEQVVKQKGEAWNWWNNFVKWIMGKFNSLSKLEKQELTQILTDAFLTRQDLDPSQDIDGFKEFVSGTQQTSEVDLGTQTAPAGSKVIIDSVKGKSPQPGAVVAFRTKGKTEQHMIDALKDNVVGNPFGPYAAIKENDIGTAVTRFLNWLEGTADTNIMQDYRQALLAKVPELEGKTIFYYKDLGRPSHATALDYFLNKEDTQPTTTQQTSEVEAPSQLTPWGDAQMFEDNVPAKHLVGIVAALQKSFNLFSNNKEDLPFSIKIRSHEGSVNKQTNGEAITNFFDDKHIDKVGNWYGVAQLLNIVLDNAKWQYASKLGLDMQSVFSYVLLKRLGYSLDDLALMFNSPIVKEYMDFKRGRSKKYISKDSDIKRMFIEEDKIHFNELLEFLKTKGYKSLTYKNTKRGESYNVKAWNKLTNRIKSGIELDINKLINKDKIAELDAVLMLYTLEKYNQDVVRPFSKAFTIHQGVEKNPLELKAIVDDIQRIIDGPVVINKKQKGGLNISYEMGDTTRNSIVTHSMKLFNNLLDRATVTDIRFTPYMQSILSTEEAKELLNNFDNEHNKTEIYNQVVINDLKQNISLLHGAKDKETLLKEFNALKVKYPENIFIHNILEVVEGESIIVSNTEINEFTSYKKLNNIREEFDKLNDKDKNLILELEFVFNSFGLKGTSFSPFFSRDYMNMINAEIEQIIKQNQTKQAEVGADRLTQELKNAIKEVNNPVYKKSIDRTITESAKNDRTIIIPEPRKPSSTGRQVLNESDTNRFKKYLKESEGKLPNEFFTASTTFKEFFSPELGRRQKAPDSSIWIKNEDNLYDLIDQESGEIYINNVNLRTGKQMHFDDKGSDTGPIRRAKKVIGSNVSFNSDHLGGGVKKLTFSLWASDKGIDLKKVNPKSKTYKLLENRYTSYLHDLSLVEKFTDHLKNVKPIADMSMNKLMQKAAEFRKMDNTATKGIAYLLEKEIGQRAFKYQSEFLRQAGIKQGYKYNIPGEEGVPQEDITNFRKWLGSNNMTSKRPEIQYLINEAEKEYTKYIKRFKVYKEIINTKNRALIKSKRKTLTLLEKTKQVFNFNDRYKYIYGNITIIENNEIRLLNESEIDKVWSSLSKEEREYYTTYKSIVQLFTKAISDTGMTNAEVKVPLMQMGEIEAMSRSGLFGLYNLNIDSIDYDKVKVYGKDTNGKRSLKTFYEWKHHVYKGRTKKVSGLIELNELDKLRKKAKDLKAKGKHEDGTDIILSDIEFDALVNNGATLQKIANIKKESLTDFDLEIINEYNRRKGASLETATYDLNTSLLEFVRGTLFRHGDESIAKDGFAGMGNLSILTDSIIGFNKNLDNKNAVEYLVGWWKEGFLEKKKRVGVFGETGDKIIDSFVRLTSLRLLGFNVSVAIGNTLAGKYQELRKRGGKQFVKGEVRFWKHYKKSRKILKEQRVIQYSFDDLVHLSERKGIIGKVIDKSFIFMDQTEHYIQGAAFLGMLTDKEFETGVISGERTRYINHKIATIHGEGYTSLDASLLSMYSYGRAILQFKKWFVTLLADRFSPEDINRFGEVNIGSYRPGAEFANKMIRKFFKGDLSMEDFVKEYKGMSKERKQEVENVIRGMALGISLLSLIAIMEDDDDPDEITLKYLKKLSHDIFAANDIERFVKYRIVPSSYSTFQNTANMIGEAARGDEVKRSGSYGDPGSSKAMKTAKYEISPFAEARKDVSSIFYKKNGNKNMTSSLIR